MSTINAMDLELKRVSNFNGYKEQLQMLHIEM